MNKFNKVIIPTTLAFMMCTNIPVLAAEKEETVYTILNENGGIKGTYVVNSFNMKSDGEINDYGKYSEVKNISTTDKINYNNGKVNAKVESGKFYYEGKMEKKDIPWNFSIKYFLDGKEISSDKLPGANGKLTMKITIKKNKDINEIFFNNYALQISIQLDGDKCKNIKADGATMANVGSIKNLTYIQFPKEENTYTITTDVSNFEMDPIQINGIIMGMDIKTDDKEELINSLNDLSSGISTLDKGVSDLQSGTSTYKEAVSTLTSSSDEFVNGTDQLNKGAEELKKGLETAKSGSEDLNSGLDTLLNGSLEYQKNLNKYSDSIIELANGLKGIIPDEKIAEIVQGATAIKEGYNNINSGISNSKLGSDSLSSGISDLASASGQLSDGTNNIYNSSLKLQSGAYSLLDGIDEINNGTNSIKSGTGELKSNTDGMSDEANKKIEDMLSKYTTKDFSPVSFVSDRNKEVSAVQFVIRTDGIKIDEDNVKEEEEKSTSFKDKLLALFKK